MDVTQQAQTREPTVEELIAIGRDREAVAVARAGSMDGVGQLDEIMPLLEVLVDGIGPDDLGRSSPCAGFTVAGVLEHMIGGASVFAPAFRGEPGKAVAGDSGHGTPQERWRRAMADLSDAMHADGAQERTIHAPFGDVPGAVFARYVAFDGLVHGWDLATATGQAYEPPADVVRDVDAFARGFLPDELRDGDTFAAETPAPEGADPLERLVAFTGRALPTEEDQ